MNAEFFPNEEKDIETLLHEVIELGYEAEILNNSVAVKVKDTNDFYSLADALYEKVDRTQSVNLNEESEVIECKKLNETELNSLKIYLGLTSKNEKMEVLSRLGENIDSIKEKIYEDLINAFKKLNL